jgi:diguanylate cyclase (GGDEF)-like protein
VSSSFELRHRALEALLDFVEQVNKIETLDDAIWHLAKHTIKELDFEDCVIYRLKDDHQTLIQVAAFGHKNPKRKEILNPISITINNGVVGCAAFEKKSQLVFDTRLQKNYIVDDQVRLSELAVPILFHDKLLGVIDSEHSVANFFTHEHRRYIEILASVLASKITSEESISSLQKHILIQKQSQKLVETYLKISELTYSSISIEDFYLNLHQLIAKQVNTHSFYIVLYDSKTDEYSCPYIHDEENGSEFNIDISNQHLSNSLIAEVIKNQESRLVANETLSTRQKQTPFALEKSQAFSWLAVPFEIGKTLHGGIALQSFNEGIIFSAKDKEFLTFLGQHIATAIKYKLKDQKLQYQALHDSVTGLANRSLFLDRIEHAFLRAKRKISTELAVLFIDFDDFKVINDNFGHQSGDKVLQITAKRIESQLRAQDTLARLGGDEFAILLEDIESSSYAISVGHRILKAMKPAILTGEHSIFVTISIGVGLKDQNTENAEDLLKNADHAMYYAKEQGKNNIQVYEEKLHQAVIYARQIIKELEVAITENQLIFYFQPIVNLQSNEVSGFEALIRWQHPTRGLVQPDDFIQIAEQNDLIRLIDKQLLENVGLQLLAWKKISKEPVYISINISSQRFMDSKLVLEIENLISKFSLNPSSIVVEVTEHVLMDNIGKARLLFHKLKMLGIKISLDDFGTGYSSLSYLHQLPFDIIKIDRVFISHINRRKPNNPIINTIISLAQTLNMQVVAEGIENDLQLSVLKSLNCTFGQGYYFAKPLPVKEAEKLVIERKITDKKIQAP